MLNALLISAEAAKLILHYGICAAIIFIALIAIGCMKRHTKKEMRTETVKKRCVKAKEYAQSLLSGKDKANLLGSTKLMKLDAHVEEAAWLAFQIVEVKKDILFEGIANTLDALATEVANESADGYIPLDVYEKDIARAIEVLEGVIIKLDGLIKD